MFNKCRLLSFLSIGLWIARRVSGSPEDYLAIHVIDDQTGRGVPLVRLQTTNKIRYYTDSNGYVAFNEPGLMNQDVYFDIASWGYRAPDVGFGNVGAVLRSTPGKEIEVKIHRINIAERLYRLTGEGIYRDTVLLGKTPPIVQGVLDGRVMGSDTVETAVYRGKLYWFWGDTDCPNYPLGNYSTTGATSKLPSLLSLDKGIDYTYFTDKKTGFARGMITTEGGGSQPTWIDGLMVVPDAAGNSRLIARFVKTKDLIVETQGLAVFNDLKCVFEQINTIPLQSYLIPGNHPMKAMDAGKEYYYFPGPYVIKRVLADFEHATDLSAYEGFTCLMPGAVFSAEQPHVDRDASGELVWRWQRGAQPIGPVQFNGLIKSGAVDAAESPFELKDIATGNSIKAVGESVAWNPWLQKWTLICGQQGGDSNLGEIWIAVANSPEGPWSRARKVATHAMKDDNNDFYNPMQHVEFLQNGGRIIYFEGTFVTTFSGNPAPTPRYNYNQILYRVDLSDPRLSLGEPPPGLGTTKCLAGER